MFRMWLLAVIFSAAGYSSCTRSSARLHSFYYYPSLNAYYDVTEKRFAYTTDGGRTWQFKQPSSGSAPEQLGRKVLLRTSAPDPWMENSAHRAKYKGINTDFVIPQQTDASEDEGFSGILAVPTDSLNTEAGRYDSANMAQVVSQKKTSKEKRHMRRKEKKEKQDDWYREEREPKEKWHWYVKEDFKRLKGKFKRQ